MDSEGESLPHELVPLAVARARQCSPEDVRGWPEDDVLDELMWLDVESRLARMHAKEMERARASR
jgi:hypothetical protein